MLVRGCCNTVLTHPTSVDCVRFWAGPLRMSRSENPHSTMAWVKTPGGAFIQRETRYPANACSPTARSSLWSLSAARKAAFVCQPSPRARASVRCEDWTSGINLASFDLRISMSERETMIFISVARRFALMPALCCSIGGHESAGATFGGSGPAGLAAAFEGVQARCGRGDEFVGDRFVAVGAGHGVGPQPLVRSRTGSRVAP